MLLALGWAVFLGLTFGPVAGLFAEAAARLAAGEPEASAALVPSARQRALLGRSLALAGGVAVFAGLVGSLAALALLRRLAHGRGSRLLRAGLLAALVLWVVTPPYLHALAGMEAGNWMRAALSGLGAPSRLLPDLPGPVSALLAQGFALMPIAMVAAAIGFLSVERDLIDAAMLLGPGHRVFLRIVLPLAAPAIFAGSGAVFVFSLIDYSTPSLFGLSSYAMEIVAEYSASRAPWRAALIALPLIAITGLVIGAVLAMLSRGAPAHARMPGRALRHYRPLDALRRPARLALWLAVGYGAMILALLLGSVLIWRLLPGLVWEVRHDLARTLVNAALAAGLALGPAALVAGSLAARPRAPVLRALIWLAALFPLAIPPSLTGVGLAALLACCAPDALRSAGWLPALSHAARFLPLAVLVIHAQMRRVDPLLIDAARLQRPPGPARWLRIELPLAAPGLAAAAGLVFCASIGELDATMMTAAPGQGVLSMRVFNYLHYGVSETVAALGLLLAAIVWTAAALGLWLAGRQG
ncbi:iron ABC transporter permease [Maritimibacter sp. HL-12]|uniref:ABC transporter permease n=1 Tax=Maritimibacter sp. HL-12 TaxID=1162418 RepID=UPI001592F7A7|nr:ABC transporter permease subunit [Maritimibacter sp. HL-12]